MSMCPGGANESAAVGMIWWNYRLCVITNPGSVPDGYVGLSFRLLRPARKETKGFEEMESNIRRES